MGTMQPVAREYRVPIRPFSNAARLGSASVICACVLGALTTAGARADVLVMNVTFSSGGITTTVNGAPLGTASGTPPVIPAGVYSILVTDTAGVSGPQFDLQGPGVSLTENLFMGEVASGQDTADLLPNSTYTWRNDQSPSVVYTFATSGTVQGTGIGNASASNGGTSESGGGSRSSGVGSSTSAANIVGSAVATFRGTLVGTVSAAGRLTLSFKGKTVSSLQAGRYTVTVTDKSRASGFTLQEINRTPVVVTGAAYRGTRSESVVMTAGQWFFYPSFVGRKSYFIVVGK
jgi:hypothetical protein